MLLIKKVFDYFVWLIFFGFLLLGGVIYATDRTYPGDYLYPFKLKFEDFALATSKILNNQVDFSIGLVVKRSNEATKILASRYGKDGLDRLDTQIELTAVSISQIADPIEKKKAAEKYIVKLNEVSAVLSEKQKDFVAAPPSSNITPQVNAQQAQKVPTLPAEQGSTITPLPEISSEISTVSQQIDNTQETIKQTIDEMTDLTTTNNLAPMKDDQHEDKKDNKSDNEKGEQKDKQHDQKNNSDKETNDDREKNKKE